MDYLPADLEAKRRAEAKNLGANGKEGEGEEEEAAEEEGMMMGLYEVAKPAYFYSSPHLESDAISNHLPKYYLDAVEAL